MTTSGTVIFRTTRDEIINGALRLVGAVDPENTVGPTTTQVTNAAQALNLMVKSWEAVGLQVWERKYGVIFPQTSQSVFVLGSPGPAGDHACLSTPIGSGFVQTTLSAAAASGASTITVTSITGDVSTAGVTATTITTAYNIGIQLTSGSVQWTTVNGAPSGTTVTLTTPLTGAAASGNYVYCYQTKLIRPLRILDAWIWQISGSNRVPMRVISMDEMNRFGAPNTTGTPTQLSYSAQSNAGHAYIYPRFSTTSQLLYIEFTKPIDDFSASGDDYDMPQEWGEALKFNLALRIAPEYEVPKDKYSQIREQAIGLFTFIRDYDQEPTSLFLQPQNWMYQPLR
jgi:hypothetical protein